MPGALLKVPSALRPSESKSKLSRLQDLTTTLKSDEYEDALRSVLEELYELVGRPVINERSCLPALTPKAERIVGAHEIPEHRSFHSEPRLGHAAHHLLRSVRVIVPVQ